MLLQHCETCLRDDMGRPRPTHHKKETLLRGERSESTHQRRPFRLLQNAKDAPAWLERDLLSTDCHISTVSSYHAYKEKDFRPYRKSSLQYLLPGTQVGVTGKNRRLP